MHGLFIRDVVQPFPRETFGKIPRFEMERFHPGTPALLAEQSSLMRIIKSRVLPEERVAIDATVEARQPATQPHRPECEITQRQPPVGSPLNLTRCQED